MKSTHLNLATYTIFTAENDPFGLLSSSSSTIIYTGQSFSTGTYSYYITAEDTHGASAYAAVNIHVIDSLNDPRTENTPPEIVLDDQDGIYEPDADGYVTITGHLVDATNYSTTYGSTYELKLYDVDDNELEPIDYTINEDLTFTMSIDMRGYEVGDIELKLKAIEKIMNLDPAESQMALLLIPTPGYAAYPFIWLKDAKKKDNTDYTDVEKREIEMKFMNRLIGMRNKGGVIGATADDMINKMMNGENFTKGLNKDDTLYIRFSSSGDPHATINKKKGIITIDPNDIYEYKDAQGNPTGIDTCFKRAFGPGKDAGDINDLDKRFIIVMAHEYGHAVLGGIDPLTNKFNKHNGGNILVWENLIRNLLGVGKRSKYTDQNGKDTNDPFDTFTYGDNFKDAEQAFKYMVNKDKNDKKWTGGSIGTDIKNGLIEMYNKYKNKSNFAENTPYTLEQSDFIRLWLN